MTLALAAVLRRAFGPDTDTDNLRRERCEREFGVRFCDDATGRWWLISDHALAELEPRTRDDEFAEAMANVERQRQRVARRGPLP